MSDESARVRYLTGIILVAAALALTGCISGFGGADALPESQQATEDVEVESTSDTQVESTEGSGTQEQIGNETGALSGGGGDGVVYNEVRTLGQTDINADVDYLFDDGKDQVRVVLARKGNADFVDVEFRLANDRIAVARLHEVGDEVRLSAHQPGLETRGNAENLVRSETARALRIINQERNYNDGDIELDTVASEIGDPASGVPGVRVRDIDDVDDIEREINRLEDRLDGNIGSARSSRIQRALSELREANRDLTVTSSESVSLREVRRVVSEYVGTVNDNDDIEVYRDTLEEIFDSIEGDDSSDVDLYQRIPRSNTQIADDEEELLDLVDAQYSRPAPDDLVGVVAVAKIEPTFTSSGIRTGPGTESEILNTAGKISAAGGVGEDEDLRTFGGDTTVSVPGGAERVVTSDENTTADAQAIDSLASIDTDRVESMVHEAIKARRDDADFFAGDLETTYQMSRAATEYSETLVRNVRADLSSIRSGAVPSESTADTNRIQRYVRNGATVCLANTDDSSYTSGDRVLLTDNPLGGDGTSGIVMSTSSTSTRISIDYGAPVLVPNYALPFYNTNEYWKAGEENVAAFTYDEIASGGEITERDVADTVVDYWTEEYEESSMDSSYDHQGIGVAVDEDRGVVYVTQSLC